MLVCWFVRLSVFQDFCLYLTNYSIKLIYMHIAHHQNGFNEEIKIMCFICRFNVYFSRNQRKCSQMAKTKTLNFKFMRQTIYHLVGHEILNIIVYFIFHFNVYFSRKWRKCSQNLEKWKFKITNLRVKRYIIL